VAAVVRGHVGLWDADTGALETTLGDAGTAFAAVAFTPDGVPLAVTRQDVPLLPTLRVRTWDLTSRQELTRHGDVPPEQAASAWSLDGATLSVRTGRREATSPDGRLLARADDARVELTEAATGTILRVLKDHDKEVTCLAFAPDGRTLATGGEDDTLRLWNVATGRLLLVLPAKEVCCLAFRGDGQQLAWGSPTEVHLWPPVPAVDGPGPGSDN
jgi:WD40 repeat protein